MLWLKVIHVCKMGPWCVFAFVHAFVLAVQTTRHYLNQCAQYCFGICPWQTDLRMMSELRIWISSTSDGDSGLQNAEKILLFFQCQRPSLISLSSCWHTSFQGTPTAMFHVHYSDVIMNAMASQITSLAIVYSTVYSGADQRKSSASLAFVRRIHR